MEGEEGRRELTKDTDEEEGLKGGVEAEEERAGKATLAEEVGGGGGNPREERVSCSRLENEHGQGLLEDEADDDGVPLDQLAVARAGEVDELESEETEDRDGPLAVGRSLQGEAKSGSDAATLRREDE